MGAVVLDMSLSLDGHVTGLNPRVGERGAAPGLGVRAASRSPAYQACGCMIR